MNDRLLCMSRPFLDMYVLVLMREHGVSADKLEDVISAMRKTGSVVKALGTCRRF